MTINGVNFTNIPNKKLGLLMSLGLTQTNIHEQETIEEYLQSERFYKLIHAIDIDWDGIEVAPNVIINNTSDLINWILEHSSSGGSGSQGPKGDTGKSAYEIAVEEGFVGSKAEWLQSLIGPTGAKGADGARGLKGDTGNDGKSAYDLYKESVNEHGDIYSFTSWSLDGNTAYGEGTVEVIEQRLGGAKVKVLTNTDFGSNPTDFVGMEFDVQQPLNEGDLIQLYIGDEPQPIAVRATLQTPAVVAMTQQEWLDSLKGADGQPGAAGQDGAPGQDGITPHIDQATGNWFIGETNTGVLALGSAGTDGITPHIDSTTGNWFIGSTDTGVSAQGPAGLNGSNGNDGVTPHIDLTSGNWFIGDTDTGVSALGPSGQNGTNGTNGQDGKSAYQSYLDTTSDDPALSESDWIASLHGLDGADGQNGLNGQDGVDGKSAYELAVDNGYEGTIQQWLDSLKGQDGTNGNDGLNGTDGKSAYLSYVDTTSDNPILTEADWIASLHGQNGLDGSDGLDGQNGLDGITPSIDPTTKHWMIGSTDTGIVAEGLNGTNGTNGTDGKSAYQSYVDTTSDNPVLTEEQWVASLHGQDGSNGTNGTNGKSAYQSYVDTTSDDPILTEQQWVASLHGTNGLDGTDGQDGVIPTIDPTTKHWMFGSTDTGVVAEGQNGTNGTNGVTPHIDSSTKHWMIGETDTGIIAEGLDGLNGTNGTNGITPHIDPITGNWFIGETNTGVHAQGETGTFDPSDLEDYATTASVNEALENKLNNIKSIELYNNDETLTIYNAGMDNSNPFYISNESIKDLLYKVNGSSVELFIDGESKGTVLFEHTVGDEYDDNAVIFGHGILKDNFVPLSEDGWLYADYSEDDNSIIINPNITVDGNTLTAGSVHNIKLVLNVSYDVIIMDTQSKIGNIGNKVEAAEEVYYTEEEANAYNATLEGALEAGEPLTQEQAGAYNAAITGATKEENDELSEAEANLYNATLTDAVSTYDVKTPAVTAVPYTNVGEVLSDIKTQLGGISIVKITQTAYGNLQTKDPNTLYIVIED